MQAQEKARWREWAESLRQEMMGDLTPQVARSVERITEEIGEGRSLSRLRSPRFWSACQAGKAPYEVLLKAGFEVEFEPNGKQQVDSVTLRLNNTWKSILQGVLDRRV